HGARIPNSRESQMSFLKTLFASTPLKRAWNNCARADQGLLMRAMMFRESFKAAGMEMQPDESALKQLDEIAEVKEATEVTLDGISVFLGCILAEQLGGRWVRTRDGRFQLADVGVNKVTIDLEGDIHSKMFGPSSITPSALYSTIKAKS